VVATALPERDRARFVTENRADPMLIKNWEALVRREFGFFGIWNNLARQPARVAEAYRPVLDGLQMGPRKDLLNPLVIERFKKESPRTLAQVANIYGRLFARTDPEWEALLIPMMDQALLRQLPRPAMNQYRQLRRQSDLLELVEPGAPARAHVLEDVPKPADSPILIRGQAEAPGDMAPRRFLEVLSGARRPRFNDGSGRLELAEAIASSSNPLTARVLVNRVWQHHFGDGFVTTPDDLGNQSTPPSQPELLDWLASTFMADGWSIKKLHRLILLSSSWQQSTTNNPAFAAKDPFNRLLWRANIRRLEFEPLRDSILAIGGGLDLTMGGHPVDLSGGVLAQQPGRGGRGNAANLLPAAPRRSIYGFIDREDLAEILNTFDVPPPNATAGKRYETTVPQQALFLMNSPIVIEQMRNIVNRPAFQEAESDDARIRMLYELFFQRPPSEEETRAGRDFVAAFQQTGAAAVGPQVGRPPRGQGPQAGPGQGPGRGRAAGRGRVGGAAARVPLNGWQEYAHALLLTNEFAFVS